MHRIVPLVLVAGALAAPPALAQQAGDAIEVLQQARAALGADKLAAVRTLVGTGRAQRTGPGGEAMESDFEVAIALPDRYRLRTALAAMGNMSIYRLTGFNGARAIDEIDRPPNLQGGNVVIHFAGPGGVDPAKMTPEQKAEADRQRLISNKKEFAQLALGIFAASPDAYPLDFRYAGRAEAPDGSADVIEVTGEGDFKARLFVDVGTHLPLMLSWMDKEPIVIRSMSRGGPGGQPHKPSPEEVEKMKADLDAQRRDAEAKQRTVEYRIYYADYRPVDGVRLPHRVQRSIDGKLTEEMQFESFKVNRKIDAGTFDPSK
jgi:hypothetical protein